MQDHLQTQNRKQAHIDLAQQSIPASAQDSRFYYEPLLSGHIDHDLSIEFVGKVSKAPLWIASMTGGLDEGKRLNHRLATAAARFGLAMGLGSCRSLLTSRSRFADFNMRPVMGNDGILFANLGIAQIETAILKQQLDPIHQMVKDLKADGLIIHVNPLQESLQPEGDRLQQAPIITIKEFLKTCPYPVIVKEVGQGMGKESLAQLMQCQLAAIDFAGFGGTNFSNIEMMRSEPESVSSLQDFGLVGHDCEQMTGWVNELSQDSSFSAKCQMFIISGGLKSFLDGHYFQQKLNYSSFYAHAGKFLYWASKSQEELHGFIDQQLKGLQMARCFLRLRE